MIIVESKRQDIEATSTVRRGKRLVRSGLALLAVTYSLYGCGGKSNTSASSTTVPAFKVGVCEDYAKAVLPPNTKLCNNSMGDSNSLGWVLESTAGNSLDKVLGHLVETATVPNSDFCVQTTDVQPGFRICDIMADPYYFEVEPMVSADQFRPNGGPSISITPATAGRPV